MIVLSDLLGRRMRHVIHFDGKGFFGDVDQCIEHPRLWRTTTYIKRTRTSEIKFEVDGEPVEGLAQAAERLSVPAVLTPEETELLARFPADWTDLRGNKSLPHLITEQVMSLRKKGKLESRDGQTRRTPEQQNTSDAASIGGD